MAYKEFSYYYDYFNYNADYDKLFNTIDYWADKAGVKGKIACDLGCGTGEIAIRFSQKGYETIAVDASQDMLDVFLDKCDECDIHDILILNQDITKLDMYGTVDVFSCTFDTVNHIQGKAALQKMFDRVSLFMHPNGIFIFDMNTEYKHINVLKNNSFSFVEDEAECLWENTLILPEQKTKISIKIKDKVSGEEYCEEFFEWFYSLDDVNEMLKKSNLYISEILDGELYTEYNEATQRYLCMVKKEH